MSSNKQWEIWMERKKSLTNSARNYSADKMSVNSDHRTADKESIKQNSRPVTPLNTHLVDTNDKTVNSFMSDRQTYISFLEGRLEAKQGNNNSGSDGSVKMLMDRLDLMASKMAEVEKKVSSISKTVDFHSLEIDRSSGTGYQSKLVENAIEIKLNSKLKQQCSNASIDTQMQEYDRKFNHLEKIIYEYVNQSGSTNKEKKGIKSKDQGINESEDINKKFSSLINKSERVMRTEQNSQIENVEREMISTKNEVDSRLLDLETMVNEKMRLIERKMMESNASRSYQFHEKNAQETEIDFEIDDTFRENVKNAETNKLKLIEKRMAKIEQQMKPEMDSQMSKKLGKRENLEMKGVLDKVKQIEDKLIETTEIAMQAEKASADAESAVRKSHRDLANKLDDLGTKEMDQSRQLSRSTAFHEGKISETKAQLDKLESFTKEKFSQVKLYMAESNEMLKHHSDLFSQHFSDGKLQESKREMKDHNSILEIVKKEVRQNQDQQVKTKIEGCIEQIEQFATKYSGEKSRVHQEIEKEINPLIKKVDKLDKKYNEMHQRLFADGLLSSVKAQLALQFEQERQSTAKHLTRQVPLSTSNHPRNEVSNFDFEENETYHTDPEELEEVGTRSLEHLKPRLTVHDRLQERNTKPIKKSSSRGGSKDKESTNKARKRSITPKNSDINKGAISIKPRKASDRSLIIDTGSHGLEKAQSNNSSVVHLQRNTDGLKQRHMENKENGVNLTGNKSKEDAGDRKSDDKLCRDSSRVSEKERKVVNGSRKLLQVKKELINNRLDVLEKMQDDFV